MILVTGTTGTVGSRLVVLLVEKGEHVRVLGRDADTARTRFGERVEIAQGDFDDPDSIKSALEGADRVFLLTASAAEPGAQLRHERDVIAAAKEAGVHRLVKLSVLGADEQSPIRYARWHCEAEKALEASGRAYTILRPAAFMQGFLESVSGGRIYTSAQDGKLGMVDARDIAAVAAVTGHQPRSLDAFAREEFAATRSEDLERRAESP